MPNPGPVALLDVDDTLLFGKDKEGNDIVNNNLLRSLRDNDIDDVYLFTDMIFSKQLLDKRNQLIKALKQRGFKVHGIITPSDLVWDAISQEEVMTLYRNIFSDGYKGQLCCPEFVTFMNTHKARWPSLTQAINTYSPKNALPGKAFKDANENTSVQNYEKSFVAKALADNLGQKYGYAHTKGLMLDLFIRHMPKWVNGIVVADDNEEVIKSVTNMKLVQLNKKEQNLRVPPITAIHVSSNNLKEDYYNQFLKQYRKPISETDITLVLQTVLCMLASGLGAAIGALVGTFALPGVGTAIGTILGAKLGALLGFSTGFTLAGIIGLIINRTNARIASGSLTAMGFAGLGATIGGILGTVVFPGLGTGYGVALGSLIGAFVGVLPSLIVLIKSCFSKKTDGAITPPQDIPVSNLQKYDAIRPSRNAELLQQLKEEITVYPPRPNKKTNKNHEYSDAQGISFER